jgi:hypothetical protein
MPGLMLKQLFIGLIVFLTKTVISGDIFSLVPKPEPVPDKNEDPVPSEVDSKDENLENVTGNNAAI